MSTYDEALFLQKLRQLACFGSVTAGDVERAFWHAARDIESKIADSNPEWLEPAREYVRRETLPRILINLPRRGLRLREGG